MADSFNALRTNRPLQAVVLGLIIVGLVVLQAISTAAQSAHAVGFLGDHRATVGIEVTEVFAGEPGAMAGLRVGDAVIEIGGLPTTTPEQYDVAIRQLSPGQPVEFLVHRGGRPVALRITPGIGFPWWTWSLQTMVALLFLALAILCLFQREPDLRGRLLFAFLIAVAIELVLPYDSDWPWVLAAYFLLTGLQMSLELHLALVIPEPRSWLRSRSWVVPVLYLFGCGLGLLMFATELSEAVGRSIFPWGLSQVEPLMFTVGFPIWALGVPLILLGPATRHPEPRSRQQAALVLAGVLPWTISSLLQTVHELIGVPSPVWLTTFEPLILCCYPIAVFLAIYRYQLFDVELVVRRSLVYSALTGCLLIVFYSALGAGGVLFSGFVDGIDEVWVVATATLILGLLFTPLRRAIERLIYKRFFPERLVLRQRLTGLARELPALGKLPLMGDRLVSQLGDVLDIRWATILIADPKSGLLVTLATTLDDMNRNLEHSLLLSPEDPGLKLLTQSGRSFPASHLKTKSPALGEHLELSKASVAAPLISQETLIGLILLGPKRGGDRYAREEMELLNLLAHHVAMVFENVRLFESASRDSLTGLWRRERILEMLDLELQRAHRYQRPLAIGMADLDHFKSINDLHGHLTGDGVLKWVSHLLAVGVRGTDHVGRYGGEEFLFVLPETDLPGAVKVAERVRELVAERRLITDAGEQIQITLSIGLSSMEPGAALVTGSELMAEADRALYRAKGAGRNLVRPAALMETENRPSELALPVSRTMASAATGRRDQI